MIKPLLCLFAIATAAPPAAGYEWPQWLGPERDGLTEETGLKQGWSEGGPPRVWLYEDAGAGYSGPAVVDGKLLMIGSRDGTTRLMCLDAATGEPVWETELSEEYKNGWGDGPRGTPTVDGDRVYALSAKGALVCVAFETGAERWRVEMGDFGGSVPKWGYAESPLVDGDRVVVTPGGERGALVALDKMTGEKLWQSGEATDGAHYSSVVVAEPHGQRQYVQLLPTRVVGVRPDSGDVLWQSDWPGKVAVIPTPLVRDNFVYVTSGYGVGCRLLEITEENEPEVVYDNKVMKNHHGGVVLLGDHVYGHSDGVGWVCQEFKTGEMAWRERSELGKGAIAYADDRLYCLGEDDGQVVLIDASPEGWAEHGRFTLEPQSEIRASRGKIWTHPVIVNGKMYLRDQDLVSCYDVSAE